jgi:sugar phosphate isomerase/epimerase
MKKSTRASAGEWDESQLAALRQVHVNMPWKYLPQYFGMVLDLAINLEVGIEAADLETVSRSEFATAAKQLHEAGCRITLHGPFWDLCPGSSDGCIRQTAFLRYQQLLDLVTIFCPIQVVLHTGYDPRHHGVNPQPFLERSLSVWEPIVDRAATLGVPVLLENVWEPGPGLHRTLFSRLSSPFLGFCLDVGHQHSFSSTSLTLWVEALVDVLKEIHLHDNHGNADEHLPVGAGNIDFRLLFSLLKRHEKKPLFTLEPHAEEHLAQSLAGLALVLDDWGAYRDSARDSAEVTA